MAALKVIVAAERALNTPEDLSDETTAQTGLLRTSVSGLPDLEYWIAPHELLTPLPLVTHELGRVIPDTVDTARSASIVPVENSHAVPRRRPAS
jgi:hypothetical protein